MPPHLEDYATIPASTPKPSSLKNLSALAQLDERNGLVSPVRTVNTLEQARASLLLQASVQERAQFATLSRLLACIVNERLMSASWCQLPVPTVNSIIDNPAQEDDPLFNALELNFKATQSAKALVPSFLKPLADPRQIPLEELWLAFHPNIPDNDHSLSAFPVVLVRPAYHPKLGTPASDSLMDPEDLRFPCFKLMTPRRNSVTSTRGVASDDIYRAIRVTDPMYIWNELVVSTVEMPSNLASQLANQLSSSAKTQADYYRNMWNEPTLTSAPIEWEQSIMEGHATHPMHRSRFAINPELVPELIFSELLAPEIRVLRVPRSQLAIHGDFEQVLARFIEPSTDKDYVHVPVHPYQIRKALSLHPDAQLIDGHNNLYPRVESVAQASLRTVLPKGQAEYSIKLPLSLFITSALRTISVYSVHNAPPLSKVAVQVAPSVLEVCTETASCGSLLDDPESAKHLACIIRTEPRAIAGTSVAVCGSLTERSNLSGVPHVIRAFRLDSQLKRANFLAQYVRKLAEAFLPSMLDGFAFEAHAQNSLLRFDVSTGEPLGFAVRDFGGVALHLDTLRQRRGIDVASELYPGSSIIAQSMEEVYRLTFHCLVQTHLHRLVRALGLHRRPEGWPVVRTILTEVLFARHPVTGEIHPNAEEAHRCLFSERVNFKSFISMKISGLYRDYLFTQVPNVLLTETEVEA